MQTLSKHELNDMNLENKDDFVLINVLPEDAFREKHIRTSINIPIEGDDFTDTVRKVAGGKDRKIVVYCASFDCDASEKAAKRLEQAGFGQVYDYEGGTRDWFATS
jgi:rhodanese-related sulfurtransferase